MKFTTRGFSFVAVMLAMLTLLVGCETAEKRAQNFRNIAAQYQSAVDTYKAKLPEIDKAIEEGEQAIVAAVELGDETKAQKIKETIEEAKEVKAKIESKITEAQAIADQAIKAADKVLADGEVNVADEVVLYANTARELNQAFTPAPYKYGVEIGLAAIAGIAGLFGVKQKKKATNTGKALADVVQSVDAGLNTLPESTIADNMKATMKVSQRPETEKAVKAIKAGADPVKAAA